MDKLLSSKILHPTGYLQTHHSQSLSHINFLETKYILYKSLYTLYVGGGIKDAGSLGGGVRVKFAVFTHVVPFS